MRRYRSPFKLKLKKKTLAAISAVTTFTLSSLTLLSFVLGSSVLILLRRFFESLIGWATLPFALIGIIASFTILRVKWSIAQFNVIFGAIIILFSLLSFTTIISAEAAGLIAETLWTGIASVLTGVGAGIIFTALLLIGIIIFFNTSLDQSVIFIVNLISRTKRSIARFFARQKAKPVVQGGMIRPTINQADQKPSKIQPKPEVDLPTKTVINLPTEGSLWRYPPLSLLSDEISAKADRGDLKQNAEIIEKTLESFGIQAKVVEVNLGPAITQYALEIALGTKISKITSLQNDLALALAAPTGTIRIEAPIPGKSLVGIEIPNRTLEIVSLKSVLASDQMQKNHSKIATALGLDVSGNPVVADIAKMPHVLTAGTTGSGKSVAINGFIASLLYRNSPSELKIILMDPKRVELLEYEDIPHLLTPVIVEPEKILSALKWTLTEMDRRYKLFSQAQVRNLAGYNDLSGFQALPYIVIIIDELADLMSFAPVEVEDAIIRLAQMSRATGIHLIIATQRPSVDVITGLLKANIPCRIAFNVSSMVDSRVILDQPGAEKLLGRGDMLYLPPDVSKPVRIQGVYLSDPELANLIKFLKDSGVAPVYVDEVTEMVVSKKSSYGTEEDELFDEAVRTICQYDRASASLLQRRLRIGYARAARLLDELEAAGIVGSGEGAKPRDVLVRNAEEFLASRASSQN